MIPQLKTLNSTPLTSFCGQYRQVSDKLPIISIKRLCRCIKRYTKCWIAGVKLENLSDIRIVNYADGQGTR